MHVDLPEELIGEQKSDQAVLGDFMRRKRNSPLKVRLKISISKETEGFILALVQLRSISNAELGLLQGLGELFLSL